MNIKLKIILSLFIFSLIKKIESDQKKIDKVDRP